LRRAPNGIGRATIRGLGGSAVLGDTTELVGGALRLGALVLAAPVIPVVGATEFDLEALGSVEAWGGRDG
jgi:hypothetical protein